MLAVIADLIRAYLRLVAEGWRDLDDPEDTPRDDRAPSGPTFHRDRLDGSPSGPPTALRADRPAYLRPLGSGRPAR